MTVRTTGAWGVWLAATVLWLASAAAWGADATADLDHLVGQPANVSAWAYAYRADLPAQEKPEAYLIPRRLERLDNVYRPLCLWFAQPGLKERLPQPPYAHLLSLKQVAEEGAMLPPAQGTLQAALLWEARMHLNRLELHWPDAAAVPAVEQVEVRVYPSPYGWFGWQKDQRVTAPPEISSDRQTWTYHGDWNGIDMVAVFVQPKEGVPADQAAAALKAAVPQFHTYGPETWERLDVQIEWGLKAGTEKAPFDGHLEGFFGLLGKMTPLAGDSGTTLDGPQAWKSQAGSGNRRGVAVSLLCIRPAAEQANNLPKFPYGHPRDTRITVLTSSGSFTFLTKNLDQGPILAPEYGFFVAKADSGKTGQAFAKELAATNVKSIREQTREHREATWDEAMREIALPLLPPGTKLPAYKATDDPPILVELPEQCWQDAWRMGASQLRKGELTYMDLALEAPRPIHDMDLTGLHEASATWLGGFLQRAGSPGDGDFADGSGNFCIGRLFRGTPITDAPGYPTYELIHNGGTGRILYDLAEHYFLTGDRAWLQKNLWRMQAAAEWIIRQRAQYLQNIPNRDKLLVAGLHPAQHITDCAWGYSEWKWYTNIDAWYCQGLRRFAEAMRDLDPENAAKYLAESEQYHDALHKAVDQGITLAPVMRVRNGTYRSYIPPILYTRGPSIGQVTQIAMTDDDWPLELVDAVGIPALDDPRVDGLLDVCEDVLSLNHTYLYSGDRYPYLCERRKATGRDPSEDWFWGGGSPQLGYSYLANVYLRRDEIPSFLRQWVNNYAAFVMPTPEYVFTEHFMNHTHPKVLEHLEQGDYHRLLNGHALSYFMEQFRSLLVWEEGDVLWLAKATPRHWLAQGQRIAVKNAPSYFGTVGYTLVSDAEHGAITGTVELPTRRPPKAVYLRFRYPEGRPMRRVTVNGQPWDDFDPGKEIVRLHDLVGTAAVRAEY